MSRWIICICSLCLFASTTLADDPTDQPDQSAADAAYARLQAKQAAATQPATISVADLNGLRAELAQLKAENTALKAQVAKLTAEMASAAKTNPGGGANTPPAAAAKPSDDIKAAMAQHTLAIGMTLDQCNKSIGRPGELKGATTEGQSYEWYQSGGRDNLGNPQWTITYSGTIVDGKLVSFNKGDAVPFDAGSFGVRN